ERPEPPRHLERKIDVDLHAPPRRERRLERHAQKRALTRARMVAHLHRRRVTVDEHVFRPHVPRIEAIRIDPEKILTVERRHARREPLGIAPQPQLRQRRAGRIGRRDARVAFDPPRLGVDAHAHLVHRQLRLRRRARLGERGRRRLRPRRAGRDPNGDDGDEAQHLLAAYDHPAQSGSGVQSGEPMFASIYVYSHLAAAAISVAMSLLFVTSFARVPGARSDLWAATTYVLTAAIAMAEMGAALHPSLGWARTQISIEVILVLFIPIGLH